MMTLANALGLHADQRALNHLRRIGKLLMRSIRSYSRCVSFLAYDFVRLSLRMLCQEAGADSTFHVLVEQCCLIVQGWMSKLMTVSAQGTKVVVRVLAAEKQRVHVMRVIRRVWFIITRETRLRSGNHPGSAPHNFFMEALLRTAAFDALPHTVAPGNAYQRTR